ncbi:6-hydroxynicotinate 3-monooxygenase [Lachnellula cervina]|uniref:6-hydroxynicotinate 3-monooxygenase n=1 Tax=Lachnellula cervina TaxID=1316786 RepID=A0A7D8YUV0_9HELO|nr:6-hydroxynicotinate 3-monooxygenase [Lachnellula cervina]
MSSKSAPEEIGESKNRLKIAIVGAGIVGATAAIALSDLPNVSVTVFESSPGPQETGAWISLSLMVLDRLINLEEVQRILYRGDHEGTYITRHWRTGQIIATAPSSAHVLDKFKQARTHRVPLHNVLLSNIPEGTIRFNHKVLDHHVTEAGVQLTFRDRPSEAFDLVVAADGLYSKFRRRYTSDKVQYKGAVAYRKVFPESQVAHIKSLHNDSSSWRKDGEVMFLSRLGLEQYGVVAIIRETPEVAAKLHWAKNTGAEGLQRLQRHFATWDPMIGQVLQTMTDIDAYPLDSAPWLEQLVRHDRIAFIGDAAHPTAGAFGVGAALGQGDSWALYRSLQQSYTGDDRNLTLPIGSQTALEKHYNLRRALELYNETRRHFLGRVWRQQGLDSVDAAYIAQAANDEAEWIRRFQDRHKNQLWMTEYDVEAAFVETLASEAHWSKEVDGEDSVTARL